MEKGVRPETGRAFGIQVTVQQVCALAALTVRKRGIAGKNPIDEVDFHGFLLVTVKVLNSYEYKKKQRGAA
ncbi:MAG: hypothetical protein Q4F29_09715 [Lachnospiraceae bacterium]|nr:hypothetical protein [Lachnospiraceae bacterium]